MRKRLERSEPSSRSRIECSAKPVCCKEAKRARLGFHILTQPEGADTRVQGKCLQHSGLHLGVGVSVQLSLESGYLRGKMVVTSTQRAFAVQHRQIKPAEECFWHERRHARSSDQAMLRNGPASSVLNDGAARRANHKPCIAAR